MKSIDEALEYILKTSPAVQIDIDNFYKHDLFISLKTLIANAEKQASDKAWEEGFEKGYDRAVQGY